MKPNSLKLILSKLRIKRFYLLLNIFLLFFMIVYEYSSLYYLYLDKKEIGKMDISNILNEYSGECLAYFSSAFHEKYNMGLMRWGDKRVSVNYYGRYNNEDVKQISKSLDMINKALGKRKFLLKDSSIRQADINIVFLENHTKVHGKTRPMICGFNNEIKEAIIMIYNLDNQKKRNFTITHELLHAIGFTGHPIVIFENTFLSTNTNTNTISVDTMLFCEAEAIKLLYDKRLPNHLTKNFYRKHIEMNPNKKGIDINKLY